MALAVDETWRTGEINFNVKASSSAVERNRRPAGNLNDHRHTRDNSVNRIPPLSSALVVGYFLGTLPSADIATRLAGRDDRNVRHEGTGNPGALNAAATLGRRWGAAVLVADMAKGAAAGQFGRTIAGPAGAYLAATASIAGHIAPVWSRGRGGKGVATSAGACLAVFPAYFPVDAAVAAGAAAIGRDAERAIRVSCTAWVLAALVWWRAKLPNGWGPPPTSGLPAFAATGSLMILAKFRAARHAA